jgi:hypothetical protein
MCIESCEYAFIGFVVYQISGSFHEYVWENSYFVTSKVIFKIYN